MTREEAIKYLKAWNPIHPLKQEARNIAVNALKQTEIVRCKDCRFHGTDCPYYWAYKTVSADNWFCADGKKRE